MTPKRRDQIIAWITESELRPEAKERALAILRRPELAEEDATTVLEILQSDIERDLDEAGLSDALQKDVGYQEARRKEESDLAEIENAERKMLEFIAEQTKNLERGADAGNVS